MKLARKNHCLPLLIVCFNGVLSGHVLTMCIERGSGHVELVGEKTILKCHEVGKVGRFL